MSLIATGSAQRLSMAVEQGGLEVRPMAGGLKDLLKAERTGRISSDTFWHEARIFSGDALPMLTRVEASIADSSPEAVRDYRDCMNSLEKTRYISQEMWNSFSLDEQDTAVNALEKCASVLTSLYIH